MFKRIVLVLLLILLFKNICLCQLKTSGEGRILFRGVIIDASTLGRLGSSQIIINRAISGISADDGTFSFYANKNDTVLFSMLGYKTARLVVNDSLSGTEFLTGVYLETDTLLIGEVIIMPKLTNLKTEMMNPTIKTDPKLENARTNLSVSSYQGRTGQSKMGDPNINYAVQRQRQITDAYEKGGIPSDKMVGISPLLLIPAAYLLLRGLPETPDPPKQQISSKDMEELNKIYLETLKNRK
jgi:hypothetical protein